MATILWLKPAKNVVYMNETVTKHFLIKVHGSGVAICSRIILTHAVHTVYYRFHPDTLDLGK